jgi:hypothetical protein
LQKGSRFYNFPDVSNTDFMQAVEAAQEYSDSVAFACEAAGYKVVRLVLSPKVHDCYRVAGCANANVPYLPCHPSRHRGCTEKIRGIVAEVQLLYTRYAVLDEVYESLEQALETFKTKQGLNKLAMQAWLTEIDINGEKLAIHSFVHLPLELAQRVWMLVLHKRCEGNKMTARALFKSRLRYRDSHITWRGNGRSGRQVSLLQFGDSCQEHPKTPRKCPCELRWVLLLVLQTEA